MKNITCGKMASGYNLIIITNNNVHRVAIIGREPNSLTDFAPAAATVLAKTVATTVAATQFNHNKNQFC